MELLNFKVWATRKHDDACVIDDAGYLTLGDYVAELQLRGGIYDSKGRGWIPWHRISFIEVVAPDAEK